MTASPRSSSPIPRACPTCTGDGTQLQPFDGHCPASWAHVYLSSLDAVQALQEDLKTARADVAQLLDAAKEAHAGLGYTIVSIEGEALDQPASVADVRSLCVNRRAVDASQVLTLEAGRADRC